MPQYKLLLPPFTTPENTFSQEGEILELTEDEAKGAIAAGVLEPVESIVSQEDESAKLTEDEAAEKAAKEAIAAGVLEPSVTKPALDKKPAAKQPKDPGTK